MKTRFTITNKLILGFGILIFATLINGLFTYSTLNENQTLNKRILTIYDPSVNKLQELYSLINGSQMLVKNWVYIDKQSETPDKQKLNDLHEFEFPALLDDLNKVSLNWDSTYQDELHSILISISDTLFKDHAYIMESLNTFSSYNDLMVLFEVTPMVEEGGSVIEKTKHLLSRIDVLVKAMNSKSEEAKIEMAKSFSWFQKFVVVAIIVLTIFVITVGFLTTRSIVVPIGRLKEFLITMTKGILPKEKLITNNDEIGDMGDALNGYIENVHKTSDFAVHIGNGKYDTEYSALGEEDTLGNALIEMRENLKKAEADNLKRAEEDKISNWVTKGLADFGDILRQNSDNMDNLAKNIMVNIIDYLEVNQGAMYIINNNNEANPMLEMKSAIAYNREKFLQKDFKINEGLVGRCAFEKLPVNLVEIPDEYIKLTSGLGTAEPKNLLLVPVVINDIIMGVIEIASFNLIPDYQIEFLQTLGENIASTILNVRTNEQTQHLLDESKIRSDELSAQEEELRQNMEELQATQEEAYRREREMENNIAAINNTLGTMEINKNGIITAINDFLTNKLKSPSSTFISKIFQEVFLTSSDSEFIQIWSGLHMGESGSFISKFSTPEGDVWLNHTLTPFKNESGEFYKVVDLVIDVTKEKQLTQEVEIVS